MGSRAFRMPDLYILMKDIQGEKAPGKIMSLIEGPKSVQVLRGELLALIPPRQRSARSDGKPPHNYRYTKDPSVMLYGIKKDVSPINGRDLQLLEAIERSWDRYAVFSEDSRLEWGAKLKIGDQVYVRLPGDTTSAPTWSAGVVRHAGPVAPLPGRNFEVEIKDIQYRGKGSSDGSFRGCQYFLCEDNCAVFVSLDKLAAHFEKEKQRELIDADVDAERKVHELLTEVEGDLQSMKMAEDPPRFKDVERQLREFQNMAPEELDMNDGELAEANRRHGAERQLREAQQMAQKELAMKNHELAEAKRREADLSAQNTALRRELEGKTKELAAHNTEVWRIPANRVNIGREIGKGGWGEVLEGAVSVAVKRLHKEIAYPIHIEKMEREMKLLAEVRHPNLVQFIGAVFDERNNKSPPTLITELLDINLRQAYERNQLNPGNRLSIFMDIALALNYLHQRYDPIIHRDVSAPNVLLQRMPNHQWKGKVSDLGSANFLQHAHTKGEGCILYSAPEVIPRAYNPRGEPIPQTTKIDVYSYGVLLCEVITSTFPAVKNYWSMLKEVEKDYPQFHDLIANCTQESPDNRPTMAQVLNMLEDDKMPKI